MLEAVEGEFCLLGCAGVAEADALCAALFVALYAGGRGGFVLLTGGAGAAGALGDCCVLLCMGGLLLWGFSKFSVVTLFSLQSAEPRYFGRHSFRFSARQLSDSAGKGCLG